MEIIRLEFEKKFIMDIYGHRIELVAFTTSEHGNIKFGIEAPQGIEVNREEIYLQKKAKLKNK